MASGSEAKESSVAATIVAVLDDAGGIDALGAALTAAELRAVPVRPELLGAFLTGPLAEALVGRVHPETATQIVEDLLHQLVEADRSGTRARPPKRDAEEQEAPALELDPEPGEPGAIDDDFDGRATSEHDHAHGAPTVPPPPSDEAQRAYEDLASGAIHDRATPPWGLRRDGQVPIVGAVWILVSNDHALIDLAKVSAPAGVDVIAASSIAVLRGALSRVEHPGCGVVVDAADPSVALDRALSALMELSGNARILLWRMEPSERARLAEALPYVQSWVPCGDEVSAAELVHLLGA